MYPFVKTKVDVVMHLDCSLTERSLIIFHTYLQKLKGSIFNKSRLYLSVRHLRICIIIEDVLKLCTYFTLIFTKLYN